MQLIVAGTVFLGLLAVCAFGAADTLRWGAAWAFLAAMLGFMLVGVKIVDTALLQRRTRIHGGVQLWDLWLAGSAVWFIYPLPLIVAGFDVQRYQWTPPLPVAVQAGGFLTFIVGYSIALWAMRENRFFETFVRVQQEEGHRVVSSGPYAIVRHPGYAGAIVAHLSIPVMLGSRWALLPAFVGAVLFVIRTKLEDQTLQRDLPGYRQYAEDVTALLVPGVW